MRLIHTITMLFLVLFLGTGCGGHKEEEAPKKPTVAVKLGKAESTKVELVLKAPAIIFPREQANITPRMTGAIRELKARKGDWVKAGDLLALLENRDLTSQRDEAQAMLADAQAGLEKTSKSTIPADVERARGLVETTRASLNQAQKIYDRRKALFEQGAIPGRELLVSETDLSTAKTNFEVAKKSLELLEQQSRGQDIKIAQARVEQARSRLATMAAQLQFAELHAPFAGNITEQLQYQGDLGQPSGVIFTLVDMSVVSARAQVPEGDAVQVKLGQVCSFKGSEETSAEVAGRVTVINRAVDTQRRTVEVWCEIGHPPQALRAGSFGAVSFGNVGNTEMIVVPVTALQLEEGTHKGIVMVIDDKSVAHKREVEVGEVVGEKRIVLKGLKAGEAVIVEGGYELPEGTAVKSGSEKAEPAK